MDPQPASQTRMPQAGVKGFPRGWRLIPVIGAPPLLLVAIVAISHALGWFSVHIPASIQDIDSWLYRAATSMQNASLTPILLLLFNDPGLDYSVPIAVCLAYVWWRRRQDMVGAVAAIGITMIVGAWTMPFTQAYGFRARPFMGMPEVVIDPYWRNVWKDIPTFPSGHVREMTGLCVVLAYYWRAARWPAILGAIFVAATRVHFGAHYPTDVVAGFIVGSLAGTFSVIAVRVASQALDALSTVPAARSLAAYLFRPGYSPQSDSGWFLNRVVRATLGLCLLIGATLALGYLIYIKEPRILADYLRNTDYSLAAPIFGLLSPGFGEVFYCLFAAWPVVYPALAALVIWRSARNDGLPAVYLVLLVFMIGIAMAFLLAAILGPGFERTRPLSRDGLALPPGWADNWPSLLRFPDVYLVGVMALASTLAWIWPAMRIGVYGYAIAAAIALVYCGALWPMDALGNLMVGYWVARYARFGAGLLPPWLWWQRARSPAAPPAEPGR